MMSHDNMTLGQHQETFVDLPGRSSYMVLGLQVLTHRHI